jgi:ABC-type lipoprotein export system ATPase subunit
MAGYRRLDQGTIYFAKGHTRVPPAAENVVWIPQGSNALPARTALDNAMLGAQARGETLARASVQARSALKQVGLLDRADSLARELSGGELQRLSFARALAANRSIVFADEPTASLDLANIRIIAALLRRLSGQATIVVATHDPLLIDAADYVIDLRQSA